MAINEKYSYNDFTNQNFKDVDASEFSNSEIVGSCFYQESDWDENSNTTNMAKNPSKIIFPASIKNVTFTRCNLDNVRIPGPPDAFIGGRTSNRHIRVQNDNEDWVCNKINHKPTEPANLKKAIKDGKNIESTNIPTTREAQ